MRRFCYLLIVLFSFELNASENIWPGFNASILMSQIGLSVPAVLLEPLQPVVALYSIDGSKNSIFDPHYLNEAVLGIAFNENSPSPNSSFVLNGETSEGSSLDFTGCGCYLGGLGGVSGSANTNSGGGGSYSFYGSSSSYSMGGMGFGSGGGGGSGGPPDTPDTPRNPPPPTDPPTDPPPTAPPPILVPEPATWMALTGALLFALIWKRKITKENETNSK